MKRSQMGPKSVSKQLVLSGKSGYGGGFSFQPINVPICKRPVIYPKLD